MNTYLLPLPYDVARLINEFAYYDRTSWKHIQQVRTFRKNLCYRMAHCYTSQHEHDPETYVMWLSTHPHIIYEPQFQSVFCLDCGNYLSENRLRCTC